MHSDWDGYMKNPGNPKCINHPSIPSGKCEVSAKNLQICRLHTKKDTGLPWVLVGCFMYAKTDASDGSIRNTKDSNCERSICTVWI